MGLRLLFLFILLAAAMAAEAQSLEGCPKKCGDVEIPYPFGVGKQHGSGPNCFLDDSLELTCNTSTRPPKLLYGSLPVHNISAQDGLMDISIHVSKICGNHQSQYYYLLDTGNFTISHTQNKFITIGCNNLGLISGFQNNYSYDNFGSCLAQCNKEPLENTCSGTGCCNVEIPVEGMRRIIYRTIRAFDAYEYVRQLGNCSYAFVAKNDLFNFSPDYLHGFPNKTTLVVLDWSVSNVTCQNASNCACKNNTVRHEVVLDEVVDSSHGYRYKCKCKTGFEGNPYLYGCHDINECQKSTHNCISKDHCNNTVGSFQCFCHPGYSGNGTKAAGCHLPQFGNETKAGGYHPHLSINLLTIVLIGVSVGFAAQIVCVSWLCLVYQKRKLIKQKHKFFRQNGGFILQQRLSIKEASSQTAKIFTAEELKKATNDYHDNLVIGKGGYGTVYKGFLADNKVVAIKKSHLVHQNQTEQFINEVIILSQINYRNVVKLLGCCLETEVPLLVYEFVNNGTLFDYIHNKSKASNVSWETRLRIAAEAAGALSYLHSGACVPIIHRDVKSSNILLDQSYTAKVSDFGASKLVPLDQTELATMVQGTLGYLDPEYMQTNQLTEKSDVYSFGVVLIELLTGKKALSFDGPEEERSLAMHFLSTLKQGQLFDVLEVGIVNDENNGILKEVALLAERCLRLRGEERPSMKEVAMEIEGIRKTGKHSFVNKEPDLEESQPLLGETSITSECGESISSKNTGWDSITNHVLIHLDDGR